MKMNFSVVAIKYGETLLPERMIFADRPESEARFPISLTLYLIETGDRKILVDAGCDTMPGYVVEHHVSPAEALRRYGVAPEEITDLILTHAHHDHVEAAHYFNRATVHMQAEECAHAKERGHLPETLTVLPFEEEREICGVRVVRTGGHTPGSSIVTFKHEGREYVICGDECYHRRCLTEKRPTGNSRNPERSRAFVEKYGTDAYTVLLAHDADILPGANGTVRMI